MHLFVYYNILDIITPLFKQQEDSTDMNMIY